MILAELGDGRARARGGQSHRRWLAPTPALARAGLARPPIPQRGLGRGQSARDRALAPPGAEQRDTARHTALLASPRSGLSRISDIVSSEAQ
jgi:hypothetical protein